MRTDQEDPATAPDADPTHNGDHVAPPAHPDTDGPLDEDASNELLHHAAVALHRAEQAVQAIGDRVKETVRPGIDRIEKAAHKALASIQQQLERLQDRAREAQARGADFLEDHRDEIIALLMTAGKIALVIGIRRLTAPSKEDTLDRTRTAQDADTTRPANRAEGTSIPEDEPPARRLQHVGRVLAALLDEVGRLLTSSPSSLPLLKERYARGDPGEQAVIGMLLGPSLRADPRHAVDVIEEFLTDTREIPAADAIARRSLAPLLDDHPELLQRVRGLLHAAGPLVRRGALIALTRHLGDKRDRLGDVLAAAVIILEDHDQEVHEALDRLLERACTVDPDETARTLADAIPRLAHERGVDPDEVVRGLPEDLQERVQAMIGDEEGDEEGDARGTDADTDTDTNIDTNIDIEEDA